MAPKDVFKLSIPRQRSPRCFGETGTPALQDQRRKYSSSFSSNVDEELEDDLLPPLSATVAVVPSRFERLARISPDCPAEPQRVASREKKLM